MSIIKKIISNILAFMGMTFMVAAIGWLLYWGGLWDIGEISQATAMGNYPYAIIPFAIGGLFIWGADQLENE